MNILTEADQATSGDRNRDYGHPLENYGRTATYWNVYLSHHLGPLTAEDICWLNILQKISREQHKSKRDNWTDIAGFARTREMIHDKQEEDRALPQERAF